VFYKATLPLVGSHFLAALNAMLQAGELGLSLRRCFVWLIPKVAGVHTVAQLRLITLLSTDNEILTKMLTARLLPVLPLVLQSSQLCSVQSCSIFEGVAAVLSGVSPSVASPWFSQPP
jgi:hypothetical protein